MRKFLSAYSIAATLVFALAAPVSAWASQNCGGRPCPSKPHGGVYMTRLCGPIPVGCHCGYARPHFKAYCP
jgi:hypothetical protein